MDILTRHRTVGTSLVVQVLSPVGPDHRAARTREIDRLVGAYAPTVLVIELLPEAATTAAVSAVLRLQRHGGELRIPVAVATRVGAVRHLIRANSPSMPVHAEVGDALWAARILGAVVDEAGGTVSAELP
ncbi:hypothetical protein [Streptomyces sp. NPDC057939]|uniref:hypothetical protein n=1 Tax=Streptomyces sp. NPDC057939 TaxID=3346284 RepID=UPI0036E274A9